MENVGQGQGRSSGIEERKLSTPLLTTKLYIPPTRPELVPRPHLIERLNAGLWRSHGFARKLTLISAAAGFGKTTLVSEWTHLSRRAAAGERGPLRCVRRMNDGGSHAKRGGSPAAEVESDLANPGPGGSAARRGRDNHLLPQD